MRIAVVIFLVVSAVYCYGHSVNDDPEAMFWAASRALNAALDYFKHHYKEVNLDAVIGTRIAEGQIKKLLEKLKNVDVFVPKQYTDKLNKLKQKSAMVSELATPYVALHDPAYYAHVGTTTNRGFWTLWHKGRDADPSLVTPSMYIGEAVDENMSDKCIAEMFGTGPYTQEKCVISDKCWVTMTKPGYQLYSLSHQIFYLECGLQSGCYNEMVAKTRKFAQPSLDEQITTYCSNMLAESHAIASDGFVHDDLFMEQATLCGVLGFRQFFKPRWLKKIISWQDDKLGCYPVKYVLIPGTNSSRRRNKREEKQLGDNCLCHRTSVAIGALSQYLRYIMDYIIVASHLNLTKPVII